MPKIYSNQYNGVYPDEDPGNDPNPTGYMAYLFGLFTRPVHTACFYACLLCLFGKPFASAAPEHAAHVLN